MELPDISTYHPKGYSSSNKEKVYEGMKKGLLPSNPLLTCWTRWGCIRSKGIFRKIIFSTDDFLTQAVGERSLFPFLVSGLYWYCRGCQCAAALVHNYQIDKEGKEEWCEFCTVWLKLVISS
jgi:hypothetical protein